MEFLAFDRRGRGFNREEDLFKIWLRAEGLISEMG